MIDAIGGRKMVLAVVTLAIGTAALFLQKLGGSEFVALALGIVGTFSVSNVAATFAQAGVDKVSAEMAAAPAAPAPPPLDLAPLDARLAKIEEVSATTQQGMVTILQIATGMAQPAQNQAQRNRAAAETQF